MYLTICYIVIKSIATASTRPLGFHEYTHTHKRIHFILKVKKGEESNKKEANSVTTTDDDIIQRPESCTTHSPTTTAAASVKLTCDLIETYQSGFGRMATND